MEKESLTFENTLWVINLHKKFPRVHLIAYTLCLLANSHRKFITMRWVNRTDSCHFSFIRLGSDWDWSSFSPDRVGPVILFKNLRMMLYICVKESLEIYFG